MTAVSCINGGNTITARDMTTASDAPLFLSNDQDASWPTVSKGIVLNGGTTYFTDGAITPESDSRYPIERFAWTSGQIMIDGKLVHATASEAQAWLSYHPPALLANLATAGK